MRCQRENMLLYAVTDRAWVGKQSLPEQVECALRGGVTCVQLREKQLDEQAFFQEALEMKRLCRKYHVPFLIDDNVELAIRCGADGVHVGQSDMNAGKVRSLIGDGMLLGVSVQTMEQALAAQDAGADYLGVGAVFATSTKQDAEAVSHEALRRICAAVQIPVVAIGGIGQGNILELSGTGVDGVAVVSAIFGAEDIESSCRALSALSRKMVGK